MQTLVRERITIMLDKEPSGAMQPEVAPKTSGPSPGGPFQQGLAREHRPATTEPTVEIPLPFRQFTLQYLIAVITKSSRKD
jgi:hypothetical protein